MTSRSDVYLPDTHALVWDFLEDRRLSARATEILRSAEVGDVTLVIPTIVLAELQRISERKMTSILMSEVLARYGQLQSLAIAPFDFDTFREMVRLPAHLELHDRIIAATAKIMTPRWSRGIQHSRP